MNGLFYFGFLLFVASTVLFIVSILTRYWILDNYGNVRGIFEYCQSLLPDDSTLLSCKYILTFNNNTALRPGEMILNLKIKFFFFKLD